MTSPLSPADTSAKAIIQAQLNQWGLQSLYGDLDVLIKDGLGSDAITLRLQQTDAYSKRFAGNTLRQKAGLPVLSPAEYISAESSYRQVMQSYGLPSTFYDQPDDFHAFIGNDVSPDEVNTRAKTAQSIWLSKDEDTKAVWKDFYGLTDGAAIASILDPERALPTVQRMATAAQLGGIARQNGLNANQGRLEMYADQGISTSDAAGAFSKIGTTLAANQAMATRFGGGEFDQAQAEQATLVGTAAARSRQADLANSEKALFDARAAADANSLNRRHSGSF